MKRYALALLVTLCLLATSFSSANAQIAPPMNLRDTITVFGIGSASGSPDVANLDIGVERISQDISEAFSQANSTLDAVITAMTEVGVSPDDIRTSGLSIFSQGTPAETDQETEYRVTNRVHVVVRDLSLIEQVISAAVDAGANIIFGFDLGIADQTVLEREARSEALDNARQRAEEIANQIGVQLGDALIVSEGQGGFTPAGIQSEMLGVGGAGGAVVETGQLTVNVLVQVTYQIIR